MKNFYKSDGTDVRDFKLIPIIYSSIDWCIDVRLTKYNFQKFLTTYQSFIQKFV